MSVEETWIALLEVEPLRSADGTPVHEDWDPDLKGAFVYVVLRAPHQTGARDQIQTGVQDMGFILREVMEMEPLRERLAVSDIHPDLIILAEELEGKGDIKFDVFNTFPPEDSA